MERSGANTPRVAVLGGGVAGMTAAHLLAAENYAVTLFEKDAELGGLARSQLRVTDDGVWPGEHGFRFYPAFYSNLIRTMDEIGLPSDVQQAALRPVSEALGPTLRAGIASESFGGIHGFDRHYESMYQLARAMAEKTEAVNAHLAERGIHGRDLDFQDFRHYFYRLLQFWVMSDATQDQQDAITWMRWVENHPRHGELSEAFRQVVVSASRSMIAIDAKEGSARIIGKIALLLLADMIGTDKRTVDRVLRGPTSTLWLHPWTEHLEKQGVTIRTGHTLEELLFDQEMRFAGARVSSGDGATDFRVGEDFDHFVLAVPMKVARSLAESAVARGHQSPVLSKLASIDLKRSLGWMVGVQYFLKERLAIQDVEGMELDGHLFYPDSEWAITSILQLRHWKTELEGAGGEARRELLEQLPSQVQEILSVDISDWTQSASGRLDRVAADCSEDELVEEIWHQMQRGLGPDLLRPGLRVGHHLDDGIERDADGRVLANNTLLLVHPPGDWEKRPPPGDPSLEPLVFAGDYVRTPTGLASMESANEAARMAVRQILLSENPDRDPSTLPTVKAHVAFPRWAILRKLYQVLWPCSRLVGANIDETNALSEHVIDGLVEPTLMLKDILTRSRAARDPSRDDSFLDGRGHAQRLDERQQRMRDDIHQMLSSDPGVDRGEYLEVLDRLLSFLRAERRSDADDPIFSFLDFLFEREPTRGATSARSTNDDG